MSKQNIGRYREYKPPSGTMQATLVRPCEGGRIVRVDWVPKSAKAGDKVQFRANKYTVEEIYPGIVQP